MNVEERLIEAMREAVAADLAGSEISEAALESAIETNSTWLPQRSRLLLEMLASCGVPSIRGLKVLDIGCGYGSMTLFFAAHGAEVTGIDRNTERVEVGRGIARELGLDVHFTTTRMQALDGLERDAYDVAVSNNSLPYVDDPAGRRATVLATRDVLRPGGRLILREPNRLFPLDAFTGLPLVHWLPPSAADRVSARLGRRRSSVRVLTPFGAQRELRAAGFTDVRILAPSAGGPARRLLHRFHHVTGQKP